MLHQNQICILKRGFMVKLREHHITQEASYNTIKYCKQTSSPAINFVTQKLRKIDYKFLYLIFKEHYPCQK